MSSLGREDQWLYSGTRANLKPFESPQSDVPFRALQQWIAIVDSPFSLALDTALVPRTLPLQLIEGDKPGNPPPRLTERHFEGKK